MQRSNVSDSGSHILQYHVRQVPIEIPLATEYNENQLTELLRSIQLGLKLVFNLTPAGVHLAS